MLIYSKNYHGVLTLLHLLHSPLPRTLLPALLSIVLPILVTPGLTLSHPWTYQPFSFIVGFGIVFRVSLSYERYWEGVGSVRRGMAKLGDAYDMYEVFLRDVDNTTETSTSHHLLQSQFKNILTLYLASILQSLRLPPPFLLCPYHHCLRLYIPPTAAVKSLNPFSPKSYNPRLEPSLNLPTILRIRLMFFNKFDPSFLTELSLCNKIPVIGLDGVCEDEVYIRSIRDVYYHVHSTKLNAPAPIVSRIYQVISDANLHFTDAIKIATTPFPFPYAQLLTFSLVIFTFSFGFFIEEIVEGVWVGRAVTVVSVWTYLTFNEVARELEEVWGNGGINVEEEAERFCRRLNGDI